MAKIVMLLKIHLISVYFFLLFSGDIQSINIRQGYRKRVCEKSPKLTLCVTKNREKTFECVFEGKREED